MSVYSKFYEELFRSTEEMIKDLNCTNSSNEKKEKLKKYDNLQKVLEYSYNPFKKFNITSANIEKLKYDLDVLYECDDFFHMLDCFKNGSISGHRAIQNVLGWVGEFPDYKELIYKIIDKDLKIGMGVTEINKVFKNLIPTFDVALANKFESLDKLDNADYYISRKLDGVRCLCIIKDKNINFYSRQGNEFLTLGKIKEDIEKIDFPDGTVLDGEICIIDDNGDEKFQDVMKNIRRKNHTISNPKYILFDILTYDDFIKKKSKAIFSERLEILGELSHRLTADNIRTIEILKQYLFTETSFNDMSDKANTNGWEGLMLRKDTQYKGKRSKDILKVKTFNDAEYRVKAIETGPFQVLNKETGLIEIIETMTNVIIEHRGYDVSVGSGFSLEERKKYYNDPDMLLNQIITVKYFEESTNQNGGISLRFPVVKVIHGKKRVV